MPNLVCLKCLLPYVNHVKTFTEILHSISCWTIYNWYATSATQIIRTCCMELVIHLGRTHKSIPVLSWIFKEISKVRSIQMWKFIVLQQGPLLVQIRHCCSKWNITRYFDCIRQCIPTFWKITALIKKTVLILFYLILQPTILLQLINFVPKQPCWHYVHTQFLS